MVITKRLKLYLPNKKKAELLTKTAKTQTACVNWWIEKIREIESTNIKELQRQFYYPARKEFGLGATMTQLAEYTAIRLVRASKRKRRNAPNLKKNIISVSQLKIDKNNLGISFGKGYFWIPFHSQAIPKGKIKESKIKQVGKDWYCLLSIDIETPKPKKYKRVMGVDLGLAKIAAIADGNGKNTKFFRGEALRAKRNHYYRLRKKLQPKIRQGNVYKLLKRIGKKESNWITDQNHKISRAIVNTAKKNKRTIALEDLTGITRQLKFNKKTKRMITGWSFRQLSDFIKYKARLEGLPDVLVVDPRETSKRCPKCGHISRSNRKSQERFVCKRCGYESNADRIGAMNIAQRAAGLLAEPITHGQQGIALM